MSVSFWLTDEQADIEGYYRAKLGGRSDCCSLVRAVTNTEAGPSAGVQATRAAGGTAIAWITDPLDGTDLTAAAWILHLWAKESGLAANAAVRFQVFKFDVEEAAAALLDDNPGTELGTVIKDLARTTGVASATTMADGDRLVFKVLFDDATGADMAAGQTCTLAYNGQYPRAEGDTYIVCPDGLAVTAAMPALTRTHVRRHLKDTDASNPLLSDAEIDQAFDAALKTYSRDRARAVADPISGDGRAYQIPLPGRWIAGFSRVNSIEYPTGNQPRTILEASDYQIVDTVLGRQPLRALEFASTPDAGTDNILVSYTTRHVHNDELDTVPAEDFEAVTWLAASIACATIATKMAGSSDSVIAADSVQYRDSQLRYKQQSEAFKKMYDDFVKGDGSVRAAGAMTDWDTNMSYRGDRLFHPRRWR